jgi:hypothetical protein
MLNFTAFASGFRAHLNSEAMLEVDGALVIHKQAVAMSLDQLLAGRP